MVRKRSQYHYAIRRARGRADLTRAEHLFEASLQGDCKLLAEMKKIRCGGSKNHSELPDSVGGGTGEVEIVQKFKTVYQNLYSSAETQAEMTVLLERVNNQITPNSSWR